MKDYLQVTESVFKKAEQRIAEKKRRSAIIRRNAIAASGLAAALFIVMIQNDDIRNALKAIPRSASKGWFGNEHQSQRPTTESVTTQITTQKYTTTSRTSTTETTTTETTSTTTTDTSTTTSTTATTTTEAATAAVIVTTTAPPPPPPKPSKTEGKPLIYLGNWGDPVISATSDVIELENGMKIGLEYGAIDYRNKFMPGDVLKYNANFVYDNKDGLYYYVDGYIDYAEERNGHLHFPEYITEIDNAPYKEYYNFDDPYEEIFDGAAFIDYNTLISYNTLQYAENTVYKIEVKNFKLVDPPQKGYLKTEDGQLWIISDQHLQNMSYQLFETLKSGDIVSFAGYFSYHEFDHSFSAFSAVIKKEN
jgi:hypothetical protein